MRQNSKHCQIAIVGMACRYPDADNVEQLFENSLAQRRSFRKIPDTRLPASGYFDATGKGKDSAYTHQAALLKNFKFKREWFRVSRPSYEVTDMTHWLALTVAREVIENIKFCKHKTYLNNDTVRVIVGNTLAGEFSRANLMRLRWPYVRGIIGQYLSDEDPDLNDVELFQKLQDIERRYKKPFPVPNEDSLAGGLANTIAGRICNHFNFKGGGYTIDGACASSLLAVADGCSALASGDADMVLAGGVDLSIDPFEMIGFSRTAALAHHEMRVYDKQSEGFWPGEGCGFVALMRYQDALKQCKSIHATICGWGISSDGRGGLTRPDPEGQILALQRCYRRADYGIETVGYFEGHGTGTKIGDTAELQALINARQHNKKPIHPAIISSIKANIGHTKAAAGLAGLLRATMCVRENILPPTTACQQPHSLLEMNTDNLTPAFQAKRWQADNTARRAGINAMGFGGINTHITIEENIAPSTQARIGAASSRSLSNFTGSQDAELFLFSATKRQGLVWMIDHLTGIVKKCSQAELTDLASELSRRATAGKLNFWKAALVASIPEELDRKLKLLKKILASSSDDVIHFSAADGIFLSGGNPQGKIGFLFSGQGAPVRAEGGCYAHRFDAVQQVYQQARLDSFNQQDNTDFTQPAIVAASLGGLEILKKLGIQGHLAVGHSLGELSALHWAGCFDRETLLHLVKKRGHLMARDINTIGAMAAVAAEYEQTIAAINEQKNVFVANINAPQQTVISGKREKIEAVTAALRTDGVLTTILNVTHAFHTPLMAGVASQFEKILRNISFQKAKRKIISTVTGTPLAPNTNFVTHLRDQVTTPVHFLSAIKLAAQEVDLFLEIGPGELLTNLVHKFNDKPVISTDIGGKSLSPLLHAIAAAYILNCTPTIKELFNDRFSRRFDWRWSSTFFQNPCEAIPQGKKIADSPEPVEESRGLQVTKSDNFGSTREHLRQIIADYTGLPIWTLQDGSRMLSDLHLNSITVGEIIARFTASVDLLPPVDPTQYANASIVDIAEAMDQLKEFGIAQQVDHKIMPTGVDSWIRYFKISREPAQFKETYQQLAHGTWEGFGKLLKNEKDLLQQLNAGPHGHGVLICLTPEPGLNELTALVQAAQRYLEQAKALDNTIYFVILQYGWGAGGFARSFFLENPESNILVVNRSLQETINPAEQLIREIDSGVHGKFKEIFIDKTGQCKEPRLKLLNALPFNEQYDFINNRDVILITGGGKGISAECGYQLARKTGCALLILGRSAIEEDIELANNLERLYQANVQTSYQRADVTHADQVVEAVTTGVAELGLPVTGVVHGAGLNIPRSVAQLSMNDLHSTLSPKIDGLKNLLSAIDPKQLKLLVCFSSIIARIGLQGEADYALANEWLSHETEKFQSQYQNCRCRSIEWSVWSGTGMGQRLGRLDTLAEQGISPISIDDGVWEFLRLIHTPNLPVSLIVTGRFGNLPTVMVDPPSHKSFRFIESIPVYYPGVELVAECHLSTKSDLYLNDHVLNGERVLPAAMALEAMTEAAFVLMQKTTGSMTPLFHDVIFHKAIVIPEDIAPEKITLHLAALRTVDQDISLTIRCSSTDFQVNHVEARCTLQQRKDSQNDTIECKNLPTAKIQPFNLSQSLYQNVLFQDGRFRRIQSYQIIEARRCCGQLSPNDQAQWFSQNLPQDFLLGDPGVRDAALHAIQVCIPHKIVIPIAVERITMNVLDTHHSYYRMLATEIEDQGNQLIYDLKIFNDKGALTEHWQKIKLHIIGTPPRLQFNSPFLIAPFFERKIAAIKPKAEAKVLITSIANKGERKFIAPNHRPDGKPDPLTDSKFKSASYSGDWKLTVTGSTSIGCDLQHIVHKQREGWTAMLGRDGFKLTKIVADITQESTDVSATRVWTARESMKKAGLAIDAPLTVSSNSSIQWLVFNSGNSVIFSSVVYSTSKEPTLCVAVALADSRQSLNSSQQPFESYADTLRQEDGIF